ncbi:Hint domain-containing protein [Paracoccus sp. M683]|uniref:Hint domain-containing protein n=1 Tax=Paracoccus sp. M683 TaxID=2594268 RepID=UPI00117EFCD7|nr:Hint domain-containing protein [Paracoccus sp. M683]TRW99117.1 Hint domain-containing protein [Paracoccus sp. M683]
MPTSDTFKVIYLGNLPIIDPVEGTRTRPDFDAENAGQLVNRNFTSFTNASVQTFSPGSYSSNDGGGSSAANLSYNQDNSRGNDTFYITDANGNTVQHTFDALVQYNVVVTYADGTTATGHLNVFQDTAGNTWAAPPSIWSADALLLENAPIQGIRITGVHDNDASGMYYNREYIEDIVTVPCFAAGTMIRTPDGEVPVEGLKVGDLVLTRDHGARPIRWVGSRHFSAAELDAETRLRPIRISAGALAQTTPEQDLMVSPQHRVLVRSRIAQRMFGTDEVLVAAKQLVMLEGIDVDAAEGGVTYHHVMFDEHEVVFSNGAETESLYAGEQALRSVGQAARDELFAIFPELQGDERPAAARPLASGRMGRKLAMRHRQNRVALQRN